MMDRCAITMPFRSHTAIRLTWSLLVPSMLRTLLFEFHRVVSPCGFIYYAYRHVHVHAL